MGHHRVLGDGGDVVGRTGGIDKLREGRCLAARPARSVREARRPDDRFLRLFLGTEAGADAHLVRDVYGGWRRNRSRRRDAIRLDRLVAEEPDATRQRAAP